MCLPPQSLPVTKASNTVFVSSSVVAFGAIASGLCVILNEAELLDEDHLFRKLPVSIQFERALCFCVVSIIVSIIFIMSSLSRLKKIKMNMPFVPSPLPFFGSVKDFMETVPWDLMTAWHSQYGQIFGFTLLGRTCIAVSSPKYLKILLQTRSVQKDVAFSYKPFLPILGTGIVTAEGKSWMKQRVGISHALKYDVLEEIPRITRGAVRYLCKKLDKAAETGESVEMAEELRHLTLQVISETFFSISAEESNTRFGKMYLPIVEEANKRVWHPERGYAFFLPFFWKHIGNCRRLDSYVSALIKNRWRLRKDEKKGLAARKRHLDVLDKILDNCEKENKVTLSNSLIRQLRDELKTFMLAGHETSAAMMTWALYELCADKELTEKVVKEGSSVFGSNWCSDDVDEKTLLSRDALSKLTLCEACLKESLRKFSVVPTVSRMVVKDTQVGPHFVPKGTTLFVSIQGVHHNPDIWPDPDKFDPTRFCEPNGIPAPYTFIPFIEGPRNCLGQWLALLESKMVLGMLMQRYKFTLKEEISGNPKHPYMVPVIPKAGVDVYVSKRV